MAYKNTKALALGAVIFIVIFKIEIECLRLPSNHNNSRYQFDRVRRNVETYAPFNPTVTGTPTAKVVAALGSEIWKDRGYTISSISDGLLGANLFQPNHYVTSKTMSINSNRDAEIFLALYEEGDREGGLMEALQSDGWTLENGWYLEWSNTHKLNKVWSKNINSGETISFASTKDRMTFAILVKEGAPCTELDQDRWNPDHGGCCPGLTVKVEPRPTSMSNYCPTSDTNHGNNCWSTIVMCRIQDHSPPAEASSAIQGWTEEGRMFCRYCSSYHETIEEAKTECEARQNCEAVYDLFCDGVGKFCTCKIFTIAEQTHPKGLDCIHRKRA